MSLIGKLLVENGIITNSQLDEALRLQEEQDKRLGEILISLGYLKPKDLMWMLSEQADIPFVELKPEMLDSALINSFPEKALVDNDILPLYDTATEIYVAIGDPTNMDAIRNLQNFTSKKIVVSGAEANEIHTLLQKYYLGQTLETTLRAAQNGYAEITLADHPTTIEFVDKDGNKRILKARVDIHIKIEEWQGGANE